MATTRAGQDHHERRHGLHVVEGNTVESRTLYATSSLARRAGITAVAVPSDMYVAPSLLASHGRPAVPARAERHLRAVA